MTIQLVQQDPVKFSHITSSELYDRTTFVNTCKERLVRAKQEIHAPSVKAKLLQDEVQKQKRRRQAAQTSTYSLDENTNGKHDDNVISNSAAQTTLMFQQQDETLEDLDEAVVRVGNIAHSIHDELQQQNALLDEMEDDLQDAEEKLGVVMGKLGKLLKTKDKCQLGTIMALIVVMIVLLFLVIYT